MNTLQPVGRNLSVVQCWGNGVTADVRVIDILRRRQGKATFNLNAGKHQTQRSGSWDFKRTEVWRRAGATWRICSPPQCPATAG